MTALGKGWRTIEASPISTIAFFDQEEDEYSDLYRLTPIDQRTFELAVEAWAIWRKWELAYHSGKVKSNRPSAASGYNKIQENLAEARCLIENRPCEVHLPKRPLQGH